MIYTIGHSTKTIESFIEILNAYTIRQIVDVRKIPFSKHNPQFNMGTLATMLSALSIKYIHMEELGGLKHPHKDSVNQGWNNASFRGYADYMQTKEFNKGITKLIDIAKGKNIAILCSEALPWKCHRSLIADALLIKKKPVVHILSKTNRRPHVRTSFMQVRNGIITYPGKNEDVKARNRK